MKPNYLLCFFLTNNNIWGQFDFNILRGLILQFLKTYFNIFIISESVELPNLFELASESREEVLSSLGFDFTGLELRCFFIKKITPFFSTNKTKIVKKTANLIGKVYIEGVIQLMARDS